MTERRHKKAVRSARKCENLLDRQRGGNKNGYKWRKSVRCRLYSGSGRGWKILSKHWKTLDFRAFRTYQFCLVCPDFLCYLTLLDMLLDMKITSTWHGNQALKSEFFCMMKSAAWYAVCVLFQKNFFGGGFWWEHEVMGVAVWHCIWLLRIKDGGESVCFKKEGSDQYDFYISPFKLWQLTGYVYQGDEVEFQKMEERKKAKKKGWSWHCALVSVEWF